MASDSPPAKPLGDNLGSGEPRNESEQSEGTVPSLTLPVTLDQLEESFEEVLQLDDRFIQDYELFRRAQNLNIDPKVYAQFFQHYCERTRNSSRNIGLFKPLTMADRTLGDVVEWFQNISLLRLASVMGELTLLVALGSYLVEAPKRRQEAIHEARNSIYEHADQPFSSGRISALEFLNRSCEPIEGFELVEASVPNLNLSHCYQWNINRQSFSQFPPQLRRYKGADLSNINFQGADLQNAVLTGADLSHANLSQANLSGAILTGVNFTEADLTGAQMNGATLDQAYFQDSTLVGAQITRSQLRGVKFMHSDLTGVDFAWSALPDANFTHSNLSNANLSRTNLRSVSFYRVNLDAAKLRYADLQSNASIRESSIKNADFRSAKLESAQQIARAQHWETIQIEPNWQKALGTSATPPKVGLMIFSQTTIFDSYLKGLQSVPNIEVLTQSLKQGDTPIVKREAEAIQRLIDDGAEAIIFRPYDSEQSVPIIESAYNNGVAVITISTCINDNDAQQYLFGCYQSSAEGMGYTSTQLMIEALQKKYPNKTLNLAILDGVSAGGLYPYFEGFEQAMDETKVPWIEVISSAENRRLNPDFVETLIQPYPNLHGIWSSSFLGTLAAVEAVKSLGLAKQISVYGMLDLTPNNIEMLLDPESPLQILVHDKPIQTSRLAVERALEVLQGNNLNYQPVLLPYQIFSKDDREAVQEALAEIQQLEQNLQP